MIQKVHFLRHGETLNPEGIVYGARPFILTKKGVKQAEVAGAYLGKQIGGESFCFRSSPVRRAQITAAYAMEAAGFGYQFIAQDRDLTEAISIFDGQRVPEVAALRQNWKRLTDPHTPSWGEDYVGLGQRMSRAMSRALETGAEHAVLVSHQLPIWIMRLGIEGRPLGHDPASRQCGHASVTTLTVEDGEVTELSYWDNHTAH